MVTILLLFMGVGDTIKLPEPASAIGISRVGQLIFVTSGGDQVYIRSQDSLFTKQPLPMRFSMIEMIYVTEDRCYVLSDRSLYLCDLRTVRYSILAEEVDDALVDNFGEIWTLSEEVLTRLSALGNELETRILTEPAHRLLLDGDSVIVSGEDNFVPVPQWLLSLATADVIVPGLDEFMSQVYSSPRYKLAYNQYSIYVLMDSYTVLGLQSK